MSTLLLNDSYADPEAGLISSYFCQLFILLNRDSLQYCILETDKNRFIFLADYKLMDSQSGNVKFNEQVEAIISGDKLLQRKYPSVVVGVDSIYHTLVPEALYDAGKVSDYLGFNFNLPADHFCFADYIDEYKAYNLSALPNAVKDMVLNSYNKAAIVHHSTSILNASYHLSQLPHPSRLFLYIRSKFIDIVLYEENKVLLYNSFHYINKEDILFYTLYVIEQFSLQPGKVLLCPGGMIEGSSESYQLLAKYFEHIDFAGRLGVFEYSAVFTRLPSQRYLDLFALALCGS